MSVQSALPIGVITRTGATTPFDRERIRAAIAGAAHATEELSSADVERVTESVVGALVAACLTYPTLEHIQDTVEQALIAGSFTATARAFIAHRDQHARLRDDTKTVVDVGSSINEYLDRSDWRINANANQG